MIKKTIGDPTLTERLENLEPDRMEIFVLEKANIRGALVTGTRMVNEMRVNHDLGILETLVLGHAYLGAALFTSMMKEGNRTVLSIECGGPIQGLSVEVNALGEVRGFLKANPIPVEAPLESFDLSPFFGPGFLKVMKYTAGESQPYTGQVMLEYGNIAQDLAVYFLRSEQKPTLFSLSVGFDPEGRVNGAGGLFLQAFPGGDPGEMEAVEAQVQALPSLGKQIASGMGARDIVTAAFEGHDPKIMGTGWPQFFCRCSKDRFRSFLQSVSADEKASIIRDDDFPLRTTCHNCNSDYLFSREEIENLFA